MSESGDSHRTADLARPREAWRAPDAFNRGDTHARRGRRVILLLILLCLLNAFDLACTVTVYKLGAFEEANPVARYVLQYPNLMVLFKVSMVTFASLVLFAYRRRLFVEIASWSICGVYIGLALIWLQHLHETAAVASFLSSPG